MCLKVESKFVEPKKAEKDIECYKVIRYEEVESGKVFFSVFSGERIDEKCFTRNVPNVARFVNGCTIQKITKEKFKNEIIHKLSADIKSSIYGISIGAIHSFVSIEDAKRHLNEWRRVGITGSYALVKCIIPKGTLYYEGDGVGNLIMMTKQYASMSIIYKEILND